MKLWLGYIVYFVLMSLSVGTIRSSFAQFDKNGTTISVLFLCSSVLLAILPINFVWSRRRNLKRGRLKYFVLPEPEDKST